MNAPAISRPLLATNCDTTGSMADYEALQSAMNDYAGRLVRHQPVSNSFSKLERAAFRCGMPDGVPSVPAWAASRLASYRTLMADASVPTAAKVLSAMVRVRLAGGSL